MRQALPSRRVMKVRPWLWLSQLMTRASAAPKVDSDWRFRSAPFTLFTFNCPCRLRPYVVALVSRFAARARLVILRQRFVRRCQACAQLVACRRVTLLPEGGTRRGVCVLSALRDKADVDEVTDNVRC